MLPREAMCKDTASRTAQPYIEAAPSKDLLDVWSPKDGERNSDGKPGAVECGMLLYVC